MRLEIQFAPGTPDGTTVKVDGKLVPNVLSVSVRHQVGHSPIATVELLCENRDMQIYQLICEGHPEP